MIDEPPVDLREARRNCFRLVREVSGRLGWRYKLYIPLTVLLSSVFLLPPRFLQFFAESSNSLDEIPGDRFLTMIVSFGIGVAVCMWFAVFANGVLREWLRLTISIGLREDSLNSLHHTRIESLDTAHRGDWMTRMTSDLRNAEGFLADSLPQQIQNLTMVVGSAALFYYYSGWLAAIPCAAALLLGWFNVVIQKRVAPTLGRVRMLEGQVFQGMIESFEGLRTIRSFGGESFLFARISAQLGDLFRSSLRIVRMMAALMALNEFAGQLVVTACLSLVALALKDGSLTATDVLVYPFFINVFLGNAKALVAAAYDWNRFFIEGGRLAAVLYDDSQRRRDEHPEIFYKGYDAENDGCQSLAAVDLTIGYPDAPPLLKGYQFKLQRGEFVSIMGESGCGKSTFLEVFSGLREPSEGHFQIESSAGVLHDFPQAPVFLSAFVEQRPYLFVGSIRDNLTLGQSGKPPSDGKLWETLATVQLDEVIRKRGGLDSVLTDRGLNLSEGQRYRLALCRALLADRPFLLLDEPFAAIDDRVSPVRRVRP